MVYLVSVDRQLCIACRVAPDLCARAGEVTVIGRDSLEKIFSAASRGEALDAICQLLESDRYYSYLPSP